MVPRTIRLSELVTGSVCPGASIDAHRDGQSRRRCAPWPVQQRGDHESFLIVRAQPPDRLLEEPAIGPSEEYVRAVASFLYLHTSNFEAARDFYSATLGLDEIHRSEAEQVVGYRIGTLQLTIAAHADAPAPTEWSHQLGWTGGVGSAPSWGFQVERDQFRPTVERLRQTSAVAWTNEPTWVGYWSFPVRDPMSNTVEVTAADHDAW